MNSHHLQNALIPNLFVFAMVCLAGYTSLILIFPQIISKSNDSMIIYLFYFISIFFLSMFLWCWTYTVLTDPGRITDDLQQRGILDEVKQGNIPFCLHKLPICTKCHVPMPPKSFHCDICNSCHLRYDHHCGVVGQCIADKNTKSFILSLFYSFCFGSISSLTCFYYCFKLSSHNISAFDKSEIYVFIVGIYCAFLSLCLGNFALTMIVNEAICLKKMNKNITLSNFLKLFGGKWYKCFSPLQEDTTCYAWPGIFWFDEFEL